MLLFLKKRVKSNFASVFSKELYKKVEQTRTEFCLPSLQFSIILKDKHFTCSTGFANIEKKTKASVKTVYYLGSVSKIFVKAMLIKLMQEEKLTLDDVISKYIVLYPYGEDITLKHLLHHKSGLYDPIGEEENKEALFEMGKKWTIEEMINEIRSHDMYFPAGSDYKYTNVDYILLGIVVEKVLGKSFSQALRDDFLNTLKLNNIFYSVEEALPKTLALGYDKHHYKKIFGQEIVNIQECPIYLPTTCFMSGTMVGNSLSVCTFIHELFEGALLNEKSKRVARLFFGTKQLAGIVFREQTGYLPGYKSFCGYSSSYNLSVAFLSNYTDERLIYEAAEKILEFLMESDYIK